ncbi:hypothetical protein [Flagellimonas allohymeniacidonis]|uniref:Outer membrane protein beta-barrel domain-containing protein n=1 Tax=Flagellimonas allohymeniacidonis TaxID=2517819 RepID=A0A4V2HS92_9FLAO|nr:hypothetical protein [Allomuricauda hymeniacidonis]TAI46890.1 hypothetical protein EW142_09315 [Allomuricauda hymeniacidonis]
MRTIALFMASLILFLLSETLQAQRRYEKKIEVLEAQKQKITQQEKDALKLEVRDINRRLQDGDITSEEAQLLKEKAAQKRALNIENRIAIVENQIALLERNEGKTLISIEADTISEDRIRFGVDIDGKPAFSFRNKRWKRELKYDRRTYSDFVLAIGLNNAIIEGQSLDNSPYKIGGSRFFEMGWQWRTRVFRNSNFMRFHYGFSFQFNGLKPDDNQVFVQNGDQTTLEEFEFELDKSKLRMDNLVFPVHFEFGPSRFRESENSIRYSIQNQFRIAVGGYGGFNLGTRQKLKYNQDGERVKDKLKRDYNTSDLIYGLSAYMGFDGVLLYLKYDLNPIFKDADIEQNNISLGLRFDL